MNLGHLANQDFLYCSGNWTAEEAYASLSSFPDRFTVIVQRERGEYAILDLANLKLLLSESVPGRITSEVLTQASVDWFTGLDATLPEGLAPHKGVVEVEGSPIGFIDVDSWNPSFSAAKFHAGGGRPTPLLRAAAAQEQARFVSFDFRELRGQQSNSLQLHEGFATQSIYELAIGMDLLPDRRCTSIPRPLEREEMENIALDVAVFGRNIEILGEPIATLIWPARGRSTENAIFRLEAPASPGQSWLDVLLYYNHEILFAGTLTIEVSEDASEWRPDGRPIKWREIQESKYSDLAVFKTFASIGVRNPRSVSIAILAPQAADKYDVVLFRKAAAYPIRVEFTKEELEAYLSHSRANLDQLWQSPSFPDFGTAVPGMQQEKSKERTGADAQTLGRFLRTMAIIGNQIWNKIFDSPPAKRLAQEFELLEDGSTIQIWTDRNATGFVLPWLWLYPHRIDVASKEAVNRSAFWGSRFVIEQLRQYRETAGQPSPEPILNGGRVTCLASVHNFATASVQQRFFEQWSTDSCKTVEVQLLQAREWLTRLPNCNCDIMYFYCHGHVARPGSQDSALTEFERWLAVSSTEEEPPELKRFRGELASYLREMKADRLVDRTHLRIIRGVLTIDDFKTFRVPRDGAAPIVFLNMCESIQIWPSSGDSFVDVLLRRGARGVLGAEMPIPTAFGDIFGRMFLEEMSRGRPMSGQNLATDGRTIGEVLWTLRRQFLENGNPLAFGYSFYGDSETRFRPALIRKNESIQEISDDPRKV